MTLKLRMTAMGLLAASLAAPLAAQDSASAAADSAAERAWHAFYLSVSPGWGNLTDGCSGSCTPSTWTSTCCFTINMRSGYAIGARWALGIEEDAGTPIVTTTAVPAAGQPPPSVIFLSLAGTYYPVAGSRFWVSLDAGFASLRSNGNSLASGFSAGVGVGYDWLPWHGTFALIPTVNYQQQLGGGGSAGAAATYRASLLQIALGFGFHH